MLTKQHTIIAVSTTAVAFLSNLPLSTAALGTMASHDGYPLLSSMTHYESDYGRAQCFYGDYYGEPGSSFHLRVLKNGIRTGMVHCPEAQHWAAFDVEELSWADERAMSSLAAVAGRIQSDGNGALVFVNNAMTDGNEDMLLASEILEGICNAAVEALRKEYPSYEDLCAEYHGIAEAAVGAVGDDGWVVEEGKKMNHPK
ncbi:hypothetical protein FOZ63_019524 [Perkinsus olseni]|uniref:Uncharacterized protein n=1 Tax=Perkinsus olseni TaxID=32597 RepID=A0A7J6PC65_PEROL|nr:hypothetical protein FOZ63_019524 [Perkinsus olseni]KAF4739538.1 hypothetical protein FOZ62_007046 [Perkinsus olseni]